MPSSEHKGHGDTFNILTKPLDLSKPMNVVPGPQPQLSKPKVLRLVGALLAVRRGYTKDRDTGCESDHCWCEMAADNPMVHEHSSACLRARALLEEVGP